MSLRRLAAVAAAALLLTACGDDDGVSPLQPTRGLAGTWVLGYPPGPSMPGVARVRLPADTMRIAPALTSAWWSTEVIQNGIVGRAYTGMAVASAGPRIYLSFSACDTMGAQCSFVRAGAAADLALPDAPRRLSVVPGPHFRLVRETANRFRLEPTGFMTGETTWYYRVGQS